MRKKHAEIARFREYITQVKGLKEAHNFAEGHEVDRSREKLISHSWEGFFEDLIDPNSRQEFIFPEFVFVLYPKRQNWP